MLNVRMSHPLNIVTMFRPSRRNLLSWMNHYNMSELWKKAKFGHSRYVAFQCSITDEPEKKMHTLHDEKNSATEVQCSNVKHQDIRFCTSCMQRWTWMCSDDWREWSDLSSLLWDCVVRARILRKYYTGSAEESHKISAIATIFSNTSHVRKFDCNLTNWNISKILSIYNRQLWKTDNNWTNCSKNCQITFKFSEISLKKWWLWLKFFKTEGYGWNYLVVAMALIRLKVRSLRLKVLKSCR